MCISSTAKDKVPMPITHPCYTAQFHISVGAIQVYTQEYGTHTCATQRV